MIMLGPILAVASIGLLVQAFYRFVLTSDDYHLRLRSIMALKNIAPEKWKYSSISNGMYYKSDGELYEVHPTTWIGAIRLKYRMHSVKDSPFSAALLKDIQAHKKKQEKEAEEEISRQQADIMNYIKNLRQESADDSVSSPFVPGKLGQVLTGKLDGSSVYTATIPTVSDSLADLRKSIEDLKEMLDDY